MIFILTSALASKAPTPGGGSAAAVYGAIGTALGEMVGNLTSGKKKFAIYEEDVQKILARLGGARMDFIRLEKADEQAFQPLSEVYRMKAETKEEKTEKEERMEECLKAAAKVPMEVMERAVSVMDDIEFLALHGSRLAVSDAGVGIQGIRSALLGAVMSVYINTKMMKDRGRRGGFFFQTFPEDVAAELSVLIHVDSNVDQHSSFL